MKSNYHNFVNCLKSLLEFRVEWDDEQWNQSYISFKRQLENWLPEWVERHTAIQLYAEFAREFYQEATPETHDYWLTEQA